MTEIKEPKRAANLASKVNTINSNIGDKNYNRLVRNIS